MQSIGVRFVHGDITLEQAADLGCRACASPGGGCQFLGTAATSQVVGEALGLSLGHSALSPSGQPIWLDLARRSARALMKLQERGIRVRDILTEASLRNAMVTHAAFGGSTNLLLHVPAIAHAAGLPRPAAPRLGRDQPQRAAPRRRTSQRPPQPPDRPGVPRRRRSGGDAPSPPGGSPRLLGPHGGRRDSRRATGRVGGLRAPHAAQTAPPRSGRDRSGRRDSVAGSGIFPRPGVDHVLASRESGAGRGCDQEHIDRSVGRRSGRGLPLHGAGEGLRQ